MSYMLNKVNWSRRARRSSNPEIMPVNEVAYLGLATVYQQESRIDAMLANARKAASSNPSSSNAYIYMGDAFYAQRKIDQAIAAYNRAIELNPIEAAAYGKLVSIHPSPKLAADIEAQLNSFAFRGNAFRIGMECFGECLSTTG